MKQILDRLVTLLIAMSNLTKLSCQKRANDRREKTEAWSAERGQNRQRRQNSVGESCCTGSDAPDGDAPSLAQRATNSIPA
jgi:hypothetical protein